MTTDTFVPKTSSLLIDGYKQSGIGREQGLEGLEIFLETKSVHINHMYVAEVVAPVS